MSASVRPLRRRTKRSFASRLRTFWIVVVAVLALAGGVIYALLRWPGFQPQFIEVTGLNTVERSDILEKAAIDQRKNIWLLNRPAAEARIRSLPYVQSAHISVVPPARVTIAVVEREPFGCVLTGTGLRFMVDRERRVLEPDCGRKQQPMFSDRELSAVPEPGTFLRSGTLARMMDAQTELAAAGAIYSLYDSDSFGQLFAVRTDGIVVKFGSTDDLEKKQRLVDPILNTVRGRLGSIKAVDLRTPATPVIEYR